MPATTVNLPGAAYESSVEAAITIQRYARGKLARAMTLERRAIYGALDTIKRQMPSTRLAKESLKAIQGAQPPVIIDVPAAAVRMVKVPAPEAHEAEVESRV